MKPWLADLLAGSIAGLIVFAGLVGVSFLLTGGWPPTYLTTAASFGGMSSPLFWKLVRRVHPEPPEPEDPRA